MKRFVKVALAALLTAGLTVVGGAPVLADNTASLGMSVFRDIVVDQAAGRVFVSGGSLVASDLDGNVIGPVPGISAARQMTLSPDGSKLVVANGDFITVVDPVALTVIESIPTGVGSCPEAVAVSSGKLFFTYGDCVGAPGLGALDLTSKAITTGLSTGVDPWRAGLVSVPGAPSLIAARFDGPGTNDPANLVLLDTTGGTTPTTTVRLTKTFQYDVTDLALTSNGSGVLVAAPVGDNLYSTTDLSLLGTFPDDGIHAAVAIRGDGAIATGSVASDTGTDVRFFAAGSSVAMRKVDFGLKPDARDLDLQKGGIAFGALRAYAVTTTGQLRTLTAGPPAVVKITTDKSIYDYGGTATVTATITSPTVNRSVQVYARPVGGSRVLKASGSVNSTGKLVLHVTNLTANTTFSVVFAGDDEYAPTTVSLAVKVRAKTTISTGSSSMWGSYHQLRHSPAPTISVAVYPPKPTTTCVPFVVQIYVSGGWRGFGSIDCPKRSTTTGRYGVTMHDFPAGVRLRVRASYPTTSHNAAFTSAWYYVRFI